MTMLGKQRHVTKISRRHCFDVIPTILGMLLMTSLSIAERSIPLRGKTQDVPHRRLPPVRENDNELPTLLTPSSLINKVFTPSPTPYPTSANPSYSRGPSGRPSSVPTNYPSEFPSFAHSEAPTFEPSLMPSDSILPTTSLAPSVSPSDSPSVQPSFGPTNYPSSIPTNSPTHLPSMQPSTKPSSTPSKLPTWRPSITPTSVPTKTPSSVPTIVPSSSPTNECHDNPTYLSPINKFSCQEHKNTPCTNWRFIGLTGDQVADLIENCPVSCGIECGSFSRVNMEYSYILSYVPEQLKEKQEKILVQTSKQFFSSYVNENEKYGTFAIYNVTFRSREILSNRRMVSPMRVDRSLTGIAQLKITLMISGHSIHLPASSLVTLLQAAVDTSEFERILRGSDPFFDTVDVSSTRQQIPAGVVNANNNEEHTDNDFSATITVSVLAAVTVVCVLFATFVYQGHSRRSRCVMLLPGLASFSVKLPPRLRISTDTSEHADQPRDRIFSFGESPGGSVQTLPVTNGLMRLLGSLSSRSRDSTSSCSSDRPSSKDENVVQSEERPREHPLAGIIPPMVLIDIEDAETEFKPLDLVSVSQDEVKEMMPIKHVEASSELLEALSSVQDQNKAMSLSEMLSYTNRPENKGCSQMSRQTFPRPMLDFKDEVSDEGSVASTPVAIAQDEDQSFFHRRVSSFSALDEMEPSNTLDDLIRSQWDGMGITPLEHETTAKNLENDRESDYLCETNSGKEVSLASGLQTKAISQDRANVCLTPTRASLTALAKTFRKFRSTSNGSSDSNGEVETSDQNGLDDINIDKCITPGTTNAPRESSMGLRTEGPVSKKDMILPTSIDVAHSMSSSLSSTDRNSMGPINGETLHSFEAPCSGKLGLIIESASNAGPTIHTVKDYSPLFGLVREGDKIVRVGSKTTKHMSTGQITKLLSQKRGKHGNDVIKIKVTRAAESMNTPMIPLSPITPSRRSHYREAEQISQNTPAMDVTCPRTQVQPSAISMPPLHYQVVKERPTEQENSFHLIGAYDNGEDDSDDSSYY